MDIPQEEGWSDHITDEEPQDGGFLPYFDQDEEANDYLFELAVPCEEIDGQENEVFDVNEEKSEKDEVESYLFPLPEICGEILSFLPSTGAPVIYEYNHTCGVKMVGGRTLGFRPRRASRTVVSNDMLVTGEAESLQRTVEMVTDEAESSLPRTVEIANEDQTLQEEVLARIRRSDNRRRKMWQKMDRR